MNWKGWALAVALGASAWGLPLDEVLKGHVHQGKVDYAALRQHRQSELKAFVESLAEADPSRLDRPAAMAFWLNAYNGLVIYQVVQGATPSSVFSRGSFFRKTRHRVAGQMRTLDDIEHEVLRPLARDPRIHFVLVCGAQSCPPLRASAFLGTTDLEGALEEAARSYIADPKNVEIDAQRRRLRLNPIFKWYAEDFGDVLAFVARYRSPEERQLLGQGSWKIDYFPYDWSLNQSR